MAIQSATLESLEDPSGCQVDRFDVYMDKDVNEVKEISLILPIAHKGEEDIANCQK